MASHEDSTNLESQALGPAGTACIATTELLEAILSHLEAKTLLRAQRVSHYFHNVVADSPMLEQSIDLEREKRFLKPSTLERCL